jgi:hypothetical protein
MGVDDFRERAGDAADNVEEQVDERTGNRFDKQTDRVADEAQERIGGDDTASDEENTGR